MDKKIFIEFPTSAMKNDVVATFADGLDLRYLRYPDTLYVRMPDEAKADMLVDTLKRQSIPYKKSTETGVVVVENHISPNSVEVSIRGDFVGKDTVLGIINDEKLTDAERVEALRRLLAERKEGK